MSSDRLRNRTEKFEEIHMTTIADKEDRQHKEIIRAAAIAMAQRLEQQRREQQPFTLPQPSACLIDPPKRNHRRDWWAMVIVGLIIVVALAAKCGVAK